MNDGGDLLDVLARARAEVHQLILFDAVDAARLHRVRGCDARQFLYLVYRTSEPVEAEVRDEYHVRVRLRDCLRRSHALHALRVNGHLPARPFYHLACRRAVAVPTFTDDEIDVRRASEVYDRDPRMVGVL